jgi:hypothetical protein
MPCHKMASVGVYSNKQGDWSILQPVEVQDRFWDWVRRCFKTLKTGFSVTVIFSFSLRLYQSASVDQLPQTLDLSSSRLGETSLLERRPIYHVVEQITARCVNLVTKPSIWELWGIVSLKMIYVDQSDGCRLCSWVCGVGHVVTRFTQTALSLKEDAGWPKAAPIFDQPSSCRSGADLEVSGTGSLDLCYNYGQETRIIDSAGQFLIEEVTWHRNSLKSTCNHQGHRQLITIASGEASTDVGAGNVHDTKVEMPMKSEQLSRSAGMGREQYGQRSIGTCPNIWWSTRSCHRTPASGASRRLLQSTGTPCSKLFYQTRR